MVGIGRLIEERRKEAEHFGDEIYIRHSSLSISTRPFGRQSDVLACSLRRLLASPAIIDRRLDRRAYPVTELKTQRERTWFGPSQPRGLSPRPAFEAGISVPLHSCGRISWLQPWNRIDGFLKQ
jgi:hypothetical protein